MGLKNILFKTAAGLQLQGMLRKFKSNGDVSILCLHRISAAPDFFWQPVYPETLDALLAYCRKHYDIIPLSMANTSQRNGKPRVVLSFDDGYSDFMDAALPILAKYEAPSNHNIVINCLETGTKIWTQEVNDLFNYFRNNKVSGTLFEDDPLNVLKGADTEWLHLYHLTMKRLLATPMAGRLAAIAGWKNKYSVQTDSYTMMNWADAKKALDYKAEFGSHTVSHDSLPTLSAAEIERELRVSKHEIEAKLGRVCDVLALPNGQYNEVVLDTAKRLGYKKVMLLNEQLHIPSPGDERLLVNRINIVQESTEFMKLRVELFHRPKNLFAKAK